MTEQNLVPKKIDVDISIKAEKEPTNIDDIKQPTVQLTPSIKREDLSIVKGVGPLMAQTLYEAGIERVIKLAKAIPQQLAALKGIGLSKAQKLIENAKEHLKNRKLNGFYIDATSQVEVENSLIDDHLGVIDESEEILESEIQSIEDDEKIEVMANFKGLNKDYSAFKEEEIENPVVQSELEVQEQRIESFEPFIGDIKMTSQSSASITFENESPFEQETDSIITPEPSFGKESISLEEFKQLEDIVRNKLEENGFFIIEKTADLLKLSSKIDIFSVKFVSDWSYRKKSNGHTDLILIIPIKISPLEGSLIVSEDKIEYNSVDKDSDFYVKKLPLSYIEALDITEEEIRRNLSEKGSLFKFFNKILPSSFSLTRTFTKKNLYFHSGNNQCEILIEPIIISKNLVGFTEKILHFAYHKNSNTHVLQIRELSEFLEYVETKYLLLESSTKKKSLKELHYKAGKKLFKHLKFIMPFMTLAIVYLVIFILQAYSFLGIINKVAFGLAALMGIFLGYFMLGYYKDVLKIRREFSIPYHKRNLHLDNSSLKLINETLSPTLMEQFSYECLGKNTGFKIIEKVENLNTRNFLQEKALKKNVDQIDLFEEVEDTQISENSGTSEERGELRQKYSSFLED